MRPKPEIVPMDAYFIEIDGRILGEIFIRRWLSAALEQYGGHIGYKVRPSRRNCGVATAALRLALQKLAALDVPRALVRCSAANLASAVIAPPLCYAHGHWPCARFPLCAMLASSRF